MKLKMRLILIIALLTICDPFAFAKLNKVLFIDSYSRDYEKTNVEADVIINQLLNDRVPIDFSVQYLSSEIFSDTAEWKNRMNIFLDQCRRERPDAIVLISDEAWTTFRSCDRSELEDIPVILSSCRSLSLPLGKLRKEQLSLSDYIPTRTLLHQYNAVGELRELRPKMLFDLMDKLLPERTSYLIITDNLYLGRLYRLVVEHFLKEERPNIPVKYLNPSIISTEKLCEYLSKLDLKTATFFYEWNDPTNQVSSRFTKYQLERSTKTPFFINSAELLNSDAQVAGNYISLEGWGKRTCDIIEQILFGISPKDIMINVIHPQKLFVNCDALRRFEISTRNVPEDVVLLNEPPRFFTEYRNTTMVIIVLGAMLLVIITILVIWNRKMHVLMVREKENLLELEQKNQDLHLIQQQLVEALDKTKEIEKVKSSFLSNMSHEIRTPLNAIIGFSELLIETEEPDERKIYVDTILKNNALLLKLVNDVLDISHLDSGKVNFSESEHSVYELLCELYTNFEALIPPGIEFRIAKPKDDLIVYADRSRLYQVLSNFLSNASKFTLRGYIEMSFGSDDRFLYISIEDTGIGIPEDKIKSVFTRFEKINGYDQGVGLGLSLSLSIAEHMGGTITVESTVLKGSMFTLKLPLKRVVSRSELKNVFFYGNVSSNEPESTLASVEESLPSVNQSEAESAVPELKPESASPDSSKKRILYAEDNDSNFLLVERILSAKFQLVRARNGQEAVDLFNNESFQIVLMDLLMPVLGGIEATRKIRAVDSKVPIIAVSASVFETDVQEAIKAGCNAFLPKPVNIQRLLDTLNNIEEMQTVSGS